MEQSKKTVINSKVSLDLHSYNTVVVLSALERIRDSGNEAYLPLMFDLLSSDPADEIRKEILLILGSIKLKKSIQVFADAITDSKYLKIKKDLLSACWQNGLDFTPYFPLLIQIIIDADWETAFEAFTIIENSEFLPDSSLCRKEIEKINNLPDNLEENKKYFLKAIVAILENG